MGCRNLYDAPCCVCGETVPAQGGDLTKVTYHMRTKKFPNAVRGQRWLTKHFKCDFPQVETDFFNFKESEDVE